MGKGLCYVCGKEIEDWQGMIYGSSKGNTHIVCPRDLPKANVKPTLSEVLAKMQEKSSFNGWGVEFVALDYVKQILSEYFA